MEQFSGDCFGALLIVSSRRQKVLNHDFSPVLCQTPIDFSQQVPEASASLGRQNAHEEQAGSPELRAIQRGGHGLWTVDCRVPPHWQEEYRNDHVTGDADSADLAEASHAGIGRECE